MESSSVYDYIIIGSGFGGSVSALRLVEKGYSVLVLERGRRFRDQDFAPTNWQIWKYLWLPFFRCFGILQISLFKDLLVMHGSGVGGGSLCYANVLMKPSDELFSHPAWSHLADWKTLLNPHYDVARRMLGVSVNPRFYPADEELRQIAENRNMGHTFQPTEVGIYFGEEDVEASDPFFAGEGPSRRGCRQCGGCMVGCRHNAKNTLVKNYLYLAEAKGVKVEAMSEVIDVQPLNGNQPGGERYSVVYRSSKKPFIKTKNTVRAKNIIFSAGALGTLRLLMRCRDVQRSLPMVSPRLGDKVRTNSESLLGVMARSSHTDFSKGIAITSIFHADQHTAVEPVRFPSGSSLLRFLASPLIESGQNRLARLGQTIGIMIRRPMEPFLTYLKPGWAERTTILLVMQTVDNGFRFRLGRSVLTLFRRNLVSHVDEENQIPNQIEVGHAVARQFAQRVTGIPAGTINEGILNIPMTAHILGGVPFGRDDQEGVIGLDCQVHNYPGLFVVDGSIMPANPGVNPSLTITALAEYCMSLIPEKDGHR